MKRLIKTIAKRIKFAGIFALFLLILALGLRGYHFPLEAAISRGMSIEYKAGKISAKLKDVKAREVYEDIAKNTGIEFVGLDKVTSTIEELEFDDLSLEEAIQTLGEDTILIFRKEGPEEEAMKIKKVIFIAQKEEEPEKEPPTPLPTPAPIERTPPSRPPAPPMPEPPSTPPPPPVPIPPSRPTPPSPPTPPQRPTPPPLPTPPKKSPVPPPSAPEPKQPVPPEKPEPEPVRPKPVSRPKAKDANLKEAEKYYKQKRWDRAIKYYDLYLKTHPEDKEIQKKSDQSRDNTNEAISLYKAGKAAENAGNYGEAYRLYKKSYELYPLLYDTWERMKKMQKRL
ncbi:MAG: tetratricopeptide repeat protein [bacterium]